MGLMQISLNPGFVLLLAALIVWALPRPLRFLLMAAAALAALALPLAPTFGDHAVFGQFGLQVVPLRLDALSQLFGLAVGLLALSAALLSLTRQSPSQDALLCLLFGGAATAIYGGDLVTLAASASTAAFALVGLAFTNCQTPEEGAAARRLLAFMAVFAILTIAGAGAFLAEAKSVRFDQVGADNLGGVLLLAAFAVLSGAPGAHVWLRDAAHRLSGAAAPFALTALPMLGIYVLARAFPAEPMLGWIGVAMGFWGAVMAICANDLRSAYAYSAAAFWGAPIALLGMTAPVGLSGAAALAFVTAIGLLAAGLCLGTVIAASGTASARAFAQGLARPMPLTATLFAAAALSLVGWPGLAGYPAQALAFDAAADHGPLWLWPCLLAITAALAGGFALRLSVLLFAAPRLRKSPAISVHPPLLALAPCLALLTALGAEPAWLLNLVPPEPPLFDPFRPGGLVAAVQLLASGAAIWALLRGIGVAPAGQTVPDLDLLWRGPISAALSATVRLLGAMQTWAGRQTDALAGRGAQSVGWILRRLTERNAVGSTAFAPILAAVGLVLTLYWAVIFAAS
jgi:multicomponent Na+:H+ antiporter subunit D